MFIHVFFMFPETAGKSLEEVEAMFTDPKGIKWIGTPAWRTHVVKRGLEQRVFEDKNAEKGAIHHEHERTSDEEMAGHTGSGAANGSQTGSGEGVLLPEQAALKEQRA